MASETHDVLSGLRTLIDRAGEAAYRRGYLHGVASMVRATDGRRRVHRPRAYLNRLLRWLRDRPGVLVIPPEPQSCNGASK